MNEGLRVSLVSLGCARNLVDSEVLLGHCAGEGLAIARNPEDADVVVVNTCGFIDEAKQESIDALLEACQLKADGRIKGVVAVGCLAERYTDDLRKELPEVDSIQGISDYSGVPQIVREIVNGTPDRMVSTVDGGKPKTARNDLGRVLLTPQSYAYLRISEGCNHTCAFCAIPSMRGRNVSKPIDVLVEEAKQIAAQGVREIVLVAEDSTAYGLDVDKKRRIHELVQAIADVPELHWVRLMYAYPHTVLPALTDVLREHSKVVPYLDIPIQHISSNMLKAMRRGVSGDQVRGILERLRGEVPGIALRTTFIVGFPGETEQDFQELEDFVKDFRFERMGAFTYSHEEGTRAFDLADDVPTEVADERRDRLMLAQQAIHIERNQSLIGQSLEVLVDGLDEDNQTVLARTTADAPEVDSVVRLPAGSGKAGELLAIEVTEADDYDLRGRVLGVVTD
ncbi:MAG: 30S ribosomal protein S12 methylthiotransferase RimO [Planctomycetota bacterium]